MGVRVFFVWLKTPRGFAPQLWYGDQHLTDVNGKPTLRASLDEITIEEAEKGLDHLVKKYPAPEEKDEV